MANLRDIKRRIKSVKSTRQITHTMEMVSTTKIMRALKIAQDAAPYKDAMFRVLENLLASGVSLENVHLKEHTQLKRAAFIAIASDRGLTGGFNVSIERGILKTINEYRESGIECEVITCGKKPTEFFRTRGIEPVLSFDGLSAEPTLIEANKIALYILSAYDSGNLDNVEIWYQHAKSRVEQVLNREILLPLSQENPRLPNAPRKKESLKYVDSRDYSEYEFDPSPEFVLDALVPIFIRTFIYAALVDSAAAEHGARRRAMQAATENADDIISKLSRQYNRIRQASITTELNEIVGGAEALNESE